MAFAYFDRVKETTTGTGTGAVALGGAVVGFQAFNARYGNGDTMHYCIVQSTTGAWEVGLGTWVTGNQLQRTAVLSSSNADALVNFAAGSKDVFVVLPAGLPSGESAAWFASSNAAARDAIPTAVLRVGAVTRLTDTGLFYIWTGSWVLFTGFNFGLTAGSAGGQALLWNGTAWVAGALDLSDVDAVTSRLAFANLVAATAADKVVGSDAVGNFKELSLGRGVERTGTTLGVADTIPARGTKNTAVDMVPTAQAGGNIATATSITLDMPVTAGKWAIITFAVRCHATNVIKYLKTLQVYCQNLAGVVSIEKQIVVLEENFEGAVWTLAATVNSPNIRATLTNASGSTRAYSIIGGKVETDV